MIFSDFKLIFKTKGFKILLIGFIIWAICFGIFLKYIYPDSSKTPGDPKQILRDFIWIFYWRWNLDYLMISAWFLVILLECILFRKLTERISRETLSVWISPILNIGFSYLYMLAIDLGVTYMGDVGFNGTFESPKIIWFGYTARELYHNFFFWMIPIVIFCATINQIMIYKNSYALAFRAWCIMMAIYSLNLGLLDPVVCQILWNNWRIFGEWAMGGADAIWAEGWIIHYIIFAILWIYGSFLIKNVKKEMLQIKNQD
ncbi:MAG: hypothetical protein ACTSRZ_18995 [Promethearchaeota archaeon]